MGWYRAFGRRLFFSMDPERAHRLALGLLGLPLPWRRIGWARDDPSLRVLRAGLDLANPIGLAAGFDKSCTRLDALGALGFGYVVGGTITRAPRAGNARPRIVRDPARGALVNAMGLPNPGAEAAARALRAGRRTAPRWVSLADEPVADVVAAFDVVAPHADAIELNASSPNAGWEHRADHVGTVVRELTARGDRPVVVKVPPPEGDRRAGVLAMATAAVGAGAAGITCANTRPVQEPRLSTGRGGLSGRPLRGDTPSHVRLVVSAIGAAVPVHACGGVSSPEDAIACLEAGATTIQLYTGLIYRGPGIVGELIRGLGVRLRDAGLALSDLAPAER